jgi:hypothetical protein
VLVVIIDFFRPFLIVTIFHVIAVVNNLILLYRLQMYQCPPPPPC